MRSLFLVGLIGCQFTPGQYANRDAIVVDDVDDAVIDGDITIDTPAATTCMQRWHAGTIRFGTPERITAAGSTGADRDPWLSPDELTLYFYSEREGASGGADVYMTSRSSLGGTFTNPVPFSEVNSTSIETKMAMTADGLYIVVASSRPGSSGASDLWNSRRATTAMPFPALDRLQLGNVNTSSAQLDGHVSADGLRLYWAHSTATVQKIAYADRLSRALDFGQFTLLPELDSGTGDADPTTTPDERLIVFSSNRSGSGLGGSNMWYATRASTTGAFGTPLPIPDVSSNASDGDPWVSSDGCRIYFASDRDIDGGYELFFAEALP